MDEIVAKDGRLAGAVKGRVEPDRARDELRFHQPCLDPDLLRSNGSQEEVESGVPQTEHPHHDGAQDPGADGRPAPRFGGYHFDRVRGQVASRRGGDGSEHAPTPRLADGSHRLEEARAACLEMPVGMNVAAGELQETTMGNRR